MYLLLLLCIVAGSFVSASIVRRRTTISGIRHLLLILFIYTGLSNTFWLVIFPTLISSDRGIFRVDIVLTVILFYTLSFINQMYFSKIGKNLSYALPTAIFILFAVLFLFSENAWTIIVNNLAILAPIILCYDIYQFLTHASIDTSRV